MNAQEPFLSIDESLLEDLEPRLFAPPSWFSELIGRENTRLIHEIGALVMHLSVGTPGPALVVSMNPFHVLCYAPKIDKCVVLAFEAIPKCAVRLKVGARLLCVNDYNHQLVHDLVGGKGPERWPNFVPLVADLICSDAYRIAEVIHAIPDEQWTRCEELAVTVADRRLPPRSGTPTKSGIPFNARRA